MSTASPPPPSARKRPAHSAASPEAPPGNSISNSNRDELTNTHDLDPTPAPHQTTSKLAYAMARILAPAAPASVSADVSDARAPKRVKENPILSKQRSIEAEIDDAKLEEKAKRLLSKEKKLRLVDVARIKLDDLVATNEQEKKLKKVATRGVVKLFNAIRAAQKTVEEVKADGVLKNQAKLPALTQSGFMQMIKELEPATKDAKSNAAKPSADSKPSRRTPKGNEKEKPAAVAASAGAGGGGVPWVRDEFMMTAGQDGKANAKSWDLDSD
ncbi:hypothetical protein HDU83_005684 [Entophlyctis luteolus]|nr:hypothetical protein HDU83_005684 [Entophlyctis luteolus]